MSLGVVTPPPKQKKVSVSLGVVAPPPKKEEGILKRPLRHGVAPGAAAGAVALGGGGRWTEGERTPPGFGGFEEENTGEAQGKPTGSPRETQGKPKGSKKETKGAQAKPSRRKQLAGAIGRECAME